MGRLSRIDWWALNVIVRVGRLRKISHITGESSGTMEAEIGEMWPQAKENQWQTEAGKGKE